MLSPTQLLDVQKYASANMLREWSRQLGRHAGPVGQHNTTTLPTRHNDGYTLDDVILPPSLSYAYPRRVVADVHQRRHNNL